LTDVESEAPEWATGRTYAVGAAVTSSGITYRCATAHTAAAAFSTDLTAVKWVVWTGGVLCIEYISKETDPTKFDSGFIELLSTRLAAKLAVPLSGDMEKARLLTSEADALYHTSSMRRDSTERRLRIQPAWVNSQLIRARHA
jgi:hypothetical protein